MKFPKKQSVFVYNIIFLSLFNLSSFFLYSQQAAFPTAYGAGAYSLGGRGGTVSIVTNLNDNGPGSLRSFANVSNTTIVFNVSGIIRLTRPLFLYGSNVTIAGQTAPEGGITIEGHTVIFQDNKNLICRYIRFRGGYHAYNNDSFGGYNWSNVIFDHCSISFGSDEAFEIMTDPNTNFNGNITFQNCLIAESKTGVYTGEGVPDNFGTFSMITNVFYNITHRVPNIAANSRYDIINNYAHNTVWRMIRGNGSYSLNQLNNLYDFGNNRVSDKTLNMHGCESNFGLPSIYAQGNTIVGIENSGPSTPKYNINEMNANNTLMWRYFYDNESCGFGVKKSGDLLEPEFFSNAMHKFSGRAPEILNARDLKNLIVLDAGASKRLNADGSFSNNDDILDSEWKKNIMERRYVLKMEESEYATPAIRSVNRPANYDTDNDGMPDEWEIANGLNPNDASDRNFVQADGYTNLEYFLNGMTLQSSGVIANAGADVSICEGTSTTLTATGGSTYLWNTGATTASITVSPNETTTYTVTAYDNTGNNSDTDDVTVTVNSLPEVNAGPDVTINSGESVTLTASGAESYRWNTGATTQSIKVSPTSTTTYTVVGTTNGCEASDDVTVFSVEASVKANAGEDTEICSGSSATLTATGGSTYLWNTGATTASITVSPNATETYSVTVYGTTEGNSDTDEVIVTVKPLPIVNAGSDITIEQGESAVLTATGATSYKWSNDAEGSSITVSPSSTRTYTVTGISNGCEAKDTVRVVVLGTVEVIADAGKNEQICEGSSATLTATGGATYLWDNGATTASITVSPNTTTKYSVTAFDSTGKFSDTADVMVTVNPIPVVNAGKNVTIYSGESTVLSATGATSYKWDTGATGASINVSPNSTTTYTVTGVSNGCEATSTVRVVVLPTVEVIADAGKNQQICEGSSATLTATGGATYLWSTGETTASITVSPNSTTKYTVTVYDDTGKFSDTDDVMVTVNPLPVINAGKNVTINSGESTILTATGATSYKWNTGAVGNKITVRPTVTTTYTVIGVSNGCEAVSTVTVTVKTPQKVVASAGKDQDICEGGSVKLTATGGETYLWSTGAKTPSITVSPKSTAKYSVTAYVGDVSAKAEVVVNVTANPKVKIANGSETSLLKGERVTLSASGAKTYKWNNGAVQPNITVIPNSTQTYKVTGFNDKCAAERSVKVNVLEKVVASAGKDVTIYRNEKTVLTATGPKGSEYLWSTGETTKSITVSPEESTVYSVMVYHALDSDTANVTVNVIDLVDEDILDDSANLKFLIHPNPTNGELHVKVSGLTYLSSIHLYDLSGKSLYSEIINESDHHTYVKTLNLSNYATGIYLLQLINNNSVITKKVVLR